jgi:hypothetical protein
MADAFRLHGPTRFAASLWSRAMNALPKVALALLAASLPARAEETPVRFSRHVVPVLSRLGCAAGACHGAVQGKNGFKLSLFGSDPVGDHHRLLRDNGGRRLDWLSPDRSLLLLKGTGQVPHEGGQRFQVGSPEYALLRRWIAAGSPLDDVEKSRVTKVTLTPADILGKPGATFDLKVEAKYADGSSADVTQLCHYEIREGGVAEVDHKGRVTVRAAGETTVLVRYGWNPVLANVAVPRSQDAKLPVVKAHNLIDEHVLKKLRRMNLPPADLCDDALFLRRACLDVTGALPDPDEVKAFLADRAEDKRAKKIDELLKRPGHSALWATKWCDLLRVRISYQDFSQALAPEAVRRFYQWIRARVRENTPYDEFVARMIVSNSLDGRTREEWFEDVVEQYREAAEADGPAEKKHASRKTLDLYWHRYDSTGVKGAIQFCHQFLGLRMQCAECHRHPSDVWTQDDLLSFANFFMRVRGNTGVLSVKEAGEVKKRAGTGLNAAEKKKLLAEAKQLQEKAKKLEAEARQKKDDKAAAVRLREEVRKADQRARALIRGAAVLDVSAVRPTKGNLFGFARVTSPLGSQTSERFRFLGSPGAVTLNEDEDPRELLVGWLRKPDNPFFARAIVNRTWAHYFGRGLIDPVDDLSPLNPPTHPELLQALCDGFVKSKYDLRWLHRSILTSRTYQQSSRPHPRSKGDTKNYTCFSPRRLMAEIVVDALHHATGTTERYPSRLLAPGSKAVEIPFSTADRVIGNRFTEFAFVVLGRPARSAEAVCDCEREDLPSLQQALFLANHPEIRKKIEARDGRIAKILVEHKDDMARVEAVFLWTLGRPPSEAEKKACLDYLKKSESARKGVAGLMWSLINSKEFVLNR